MAEITAGVIVDAIQKFNAGFKTIRPQIEAMSDDELIELYKTANEITNVSWLIRCLVLGTAHDRSVRGDKTVVSLAKEFGIGRRMAEIDINVYETFIKNDKDFDAILPAIFYQIASRAERPYDALNVALEKRAEIPNYPAVAFARLLKGHTPKEPMTPGFYMLVPMDVSKAMLLEEARLDEAGVTELYGRVKLSSIAGHHYAEIS